MKKTAAIIEARMTSSRLPGKVMLPICEKPVLELLIERLRQSTGLDDIIIATATNTSDDVLEKLAHKLNVLCFRGSEQDVLERVLETAQSYAVSTIVEITGDCPLVDPAIIDHLIHIFQSGKYDYVSNTLKRTYPRGLDVQVFSTQVLANVAERTSDPIDHEHVSLYIYEHPEYYHLYNLESELSSTWWDLRLTLDTENDYILIRQIFEELYPLNPHFRLNDIIELFQIHPEWLNINSHIQQKAVR